jgi:hypothetical protein
MNPDATAHHLWFHGINDAIRDVGSCRIKQLLAWQGLSPTMRDMITVCKNGRCEVRAWMRWVLLSAACYHLLFAVWSNCWPHLWFDWLGVARPNHVIMWRGMGLVVGLLGLSFLLAATNPVAHWLVILIGFVKFSIGILGFGLKIMQGSAPIQTFWIMAIDDLIWWGPFLWILWAILRAHSGVPPTRSSPLEISEAAGIYQLSKGKSLAEASQSQLLVLVFLRHFGCTFTRQILRGLEGIEKQARDQGAELVLIHMLQNGRETEYLSERSGIQRIADPRCELYRAFGLGKGGFLELFGPQVWWRGAIAIFKGCGVGHLAGDGLQMPGAFLFHHGKIIAAQPARSAADLPDLPQLFTALHEASSPDKLTA